MHSLVARSFVAAAFALGAGAAAAQPVSGQGTWESTLQARDIDNDGTVDAYYDTVLDLSWLANANVIGATDFDTANAWANSLTVAGVSGWHLPTIHIDTCQQDGPSFWNGGGVCGYNVQASTSDMAHMYLVTLGNPSSSGYVDSYGNGPGNTTQLMTNTGPFQNLIGYGYWFSRDYAVDTWTGATLADDAWRFSFSAGRQDHLAQSYGHYAWAVHDGDVAVVAAVPEPETYALMLAGLALVGAASRRRKAA